METSFCSKGVAIQDERQRIREHWGKLNEQIYIKYQSLEKTFKDENFDERISIVTQLRGLEADEKVVKRQLKDVIIAKRCRTCHKMH